MSNHPLFEGFNHSDLVRIGSKLGFRICVVSSLKAIYPLTPESAELLRSRLEQNGGPVGFYRVACWQEPGLYLAAFAMPLTANAMACYLVGLGTVARKAHALQSPRYRYSHAAHEQPKGWADDPHKAAEFGERDALEHGQAEYKTHRVITPLPSWLHSGADVLEDLRLAAYQCAGDESGDWPRLTTDQTGVFADSQALLVDGFASFSGNTPEFVIVDGPPTNYQIGSGD